MARIEKRFQTRMPYHVHERLTHAAEISGATLNQFVVPSALEKANSVLEREQVLNLTYRDAEALFEAIENLPLPNELLIKAARNYKKKFIDEQVRRIDPFTCDRGCGNERKIILLTPSLCHRRIF